MCVRVAVQIPHVVFCAVCNVTCKNAGCHSEGQIIAFFISPHTVRKSKARISKVSLAVFSRLEMPITVTASITLERMILLCSS
jgi:hypothetical protein